MDAMIRNIANFCRLSFLFVALAGATVASAQTPSNTQTREIPRFLVYFDEFSANLSDESKATIADAAKRGTLVRRLLSSRHARAPLADRRPTNI